ncbi:hypothetical protein M9H77_07489 [Catharanthus roseus]|uniref:Uncharacterized protein n=1 Tax=Catharanthus roseus TaxID=4058 RepID=A0ACC0BVA3_CATRO|nr:hypothetical protein M9H77_07489 [Catharanthus roseus]
MVAYVEEALKNKFEEFGDKGETSKEGHHTTDGSPAPTVAGSSRKGGDPWEEVESKLQSKVDLHKSGIRETSTWRLICVAKGQLPTQSHQKGTSDPTRMNLHETLWSMQQPINGFVRQLRSVVRDLDELKRGKSSTTMK